MAEVIYQLNIPTSACKGCSHLDYNGTTPVCNSDCYCVGNDNHTTRAVGD